MDKYYLSLGRFVDAFAGAEDTLFIMLTHEARLANEAAQALFSGVRVDGAIKFVKRLFEARRETLPARLSDVFDQLATINTVRNNVLHWGVRPVGQELRVTNIIRAHSERTQKSFVVSAEALEAMIFDLGTILHALAVHIASRDFEESFTDPNNSQAQAILAASLAPWRYKFP